MHPGLLFASTVGPPVWPTAWRLTRQTCRRTGVIAAAFGVIATLMVTPSTALAVRHSHDGERAAPRGLSIVEQPLAATVDLTTLLIFFGSHLERAEKFESGVLVRNAGAVSIAKYRIAAWFELPFEEFQVSFEGDFDCSVRTNPDGFLRGHWAICDGGPIGPGDQTGIKVAARVPSTPGEYGFASLVDPQDLIEETNEQNNHARRIVTVK